MLPDTYEAQFKQSLAGRTYGSHTIKTYKSMFRRMCRDFDVEDLSDEAMLTQYRVQMSRGSVGIFDALWGILRQAEIGQHLPSAPRKPVVVYPHPLFADVMLLGAVYGNDRLPDMTWQDLENHFSTNDEQRQAAFRCLQFATSNDAAQPSLETPVVPKRDGTTPMRLWQIEYIINSSTANKGLRKKCAKEDIAVLIEELVSQSVRLNLTGRQLRSICDRAWGIGDYIKGFDFRASTEAVKAAANANDLVRVAQGFPLDAHCETARMW